MLTRTCEKCGRKYSAVLPNSVTNKTVFCSCGNAVRFSRPRVSETVTVHRSGETRSRKFENPPLTALRRLLASLRATGSRMAAQIATIGYPLPSSAKFKTGQSVWFSWHGSQEFGTVRAVWFARWGWQYDIEAEAIGRAKPEDKRAERYRSGAEQWQIDMALEATRTRYTARIKEHSILGEYRQH